MPGASVRPKPASRPQESTPDLVVPDALAFAALAARCPHPVLLTGETGSGKTHLARRIHELGPRAGRPFVRVNCAAIPDTLFERELFGHVRGAFTDAREAGTGFLEAAQGGTLFLDEVGEIPLQVQPKLLAVLEEGTFRRLGSPREHPVDVRIVTATHRDLPGMVRQGQFRQDLFYRCSVLQHRLVPLRERRRHLPGIVEFLLRKNTLPGAEPPRITPEALDLMRAHDWPGNIRELENALRSALVFSQGGAVEPDHLPSDLLGAPADPSAPHAAGDGSERGCRYSAPEDPSEEAESIREALRAEGGNRTRAARRLGMSRSSLWIKMQKYPGIEDNWQPEPAAPDRWALGGGGAIPLRARA